MLRICHHHYSFRSKTMQPLWYWGLLGYPAISSLNMLQINSTMTTQDFTKQYTSFQPTLQNKWTTNPYQTHRQNHTVLPINTQTCNASCASTAQRGIGRKVKSRHHKEGRQTDRIVPHHCHCPERERKYPIIHQLKQIEGWSIARVLPVGKCR